MDSLLLQSASLVSHPTFMLGMHLQIGAYRYTSRKERNVDFNYGGSGLSFPRHAQNAQIAVFFFKMDFFPLVSHQTCIIGMHLHIEQLRTLTA